MPVTAGRSRVQFRGNTALTSIIAIKLRSPSRATSVPSRPTRRRRRRISIHSRSRYYQPRLPFRCVINLSRHANPPRLQSRSAPTPRAIGEIRYLQDCALQNRRHVQAAEESARSAPAHRLIGPRRLAPAQRSLLMHPGKPACAPFGGVQKLIPPPAAPPHPTAANPARAIAPPARGVNVGLTVNRDDHVTKIPAVFVSATPQSQESEDADTGR
jgi:hypothetical protein